MPKADEIEMEGTVLEKLPKRNVSGRIREWVEGTCPYQWKAQNELH